MAATYGRGDSGQIRSGGVPTEASAGYDCVRGGAREGAGVCSAGTRVFERPGEGGSVGVSHEPARAVAIYYSPGRYEEAVVTMPEAGRGPEHTLATFSWYMQLRDTHLMLGRLDQSIECYTKGLQIQMEALGELVPRVSESRWKRSARWSTEAPPMADSSCLRPWAIWHRSDDQTR